MMRMIGKDGLLWKGVVAFMSVARSDVIPANLRHSHVSSVIPAHAGIQGAAVILPILRILVHRREGCCA